MKINEPSAAYNVAMTIVNAEQETFIAMALNAANEVIGKPWIVALGTVSSVNIHPRDIFREAIKRNAVSIIVAHNHPSSGNPTPSADDMEMTQDVVAAGKLLQIPVLDHVICGDGGKFVSLSQIGKMGVR